MLAAEPQSLFVQGTPGPLEEASSNAVEVGQDTRERRDELRGMIGGCTITRTGREAPTTLAASGLRLH